MERAKVMINTQRKSGIRVLAALIICGVIFGSALNPTYSAYGSNGRRLIARAESTTGDRFNYSTMTPRGVRVISYSKPRPEELNAIDNGLTDLFRVAQRHGYRARLNYADYIVFIARADRTKDSTGAYSPDMAFPATYYAGTIYDKGGFIYAAGMVLEYNPCVIVVAEHDRDWQRMANVVRYEGEHLVLYHNDRARFRSTADHARGGAHPILQ